MSEENELAAALDLYAQGRRSEATASILKLEPRVRDKKARLQLIDAALSVIDPTKQNAPLIDLSEEGIRIASELRLVDLQAFFMARKADVLIIKEGVFWHRQTSLKLAPGWIEFSTEADKRNWERLERERAALNTEIDELLARAFFVAEQSSNKRILGRVLMALGGVASARYLQCKAESMKHGMQAKLWVNFRIFRYPVFERLFLLLNRKGRGVKAQLELLTKSYLRAAEVFKKIEDSTEAHAYYNLAVHLRGAYDFRAVRKYLRRAREIAVRHDDQILIRQIDSLERIVKARNTDIPDYLHGETRGELP